jgi:hypothetical protein
MILVRTDHKHQSNVSNTHGRIGARSLEHSKQQMDKTSLAGGPEHLNFQILGIYEFFTIIKLYKIWLLHSW